VGSYAADVPAFEANLAARVKLREEEAFEELYRLFCRRILRTSMRILKEEESARDALQETFLRIFTTASHFRSDSRLWTWINRITVNVCLEIIRKEKKHPRKNGEESRETDLMDQITPSPFGHACQAQVRNRVRNAVRMLRPKHKEAVTLHALAGFTISEIADRLDLPDGTVKSRIWYGREQLRRHLFRNSHSYRLY
jgi:RNA polymerase sigma-70 factor (ECF subfamily)